MADTVDVYDYRAASVSGESRCWEAVNYTTPCGALTNSAHRKKNRTIKQLECANIEGDSQLLKRDPARPPRISTGPWSMRSATTSSSIGSIRRRPPEANARYPVGNARRRAAYGRPYTTACCTWSTPSATSGQWVISDEHPGSFLTSVEATVVSSPGSARRPGQGTACR